MRIAVVTLFPQMFEAITQYGITARAVKKGILTVSYWNPRDFTSDKHRTVDDRPFGGGPGMLMKTDPLRKAILAAKGALKEFGVGGITGIEVDQSRVDIQSPRVIYLSPQGKTMDQAGVKYLASSENLVLVCGRYQGVDERVLETDIDEEWSLGDFVISGGELAAMVLVDAMTRLQPGALGAEDSAELDSFAQGLLHSPQYTRPKTVAGKTVPDALLSGDHERIRKWQLQQSLGSTWKKRPDLLERMQLTDEQTVLLQEYLDELNDF